MTNGYPAEPARPAAGTSPGPVLVLAPALVQ
jgi:hypothetical protein